MKVSGVQRANGAGLSGNVAFLQPGMPAWGG